MLVACTSNQAETQALLVQNDASHSNKTTLSYVRAYLHIGNIKKAQEQFQKLEKPELNPGAMLALAELRAAEGDIIGAQQAFLFSFADNQLNTPLHQIEVSPDLIDFFCREKKWQALEAYGTARIDSVAAIGSINAPLSKIGNCFFSEQRWQEAKYWLEKLDFALPVQPFSYLALARMSIEQKQYSAAKAWIEKFEATKTAIDAKILWRSFEVYRALQKPDIAFHMAEHLRSLFPNSPYTRKYLVLVKTGQIEQLGLERRTRSESGSKSVKKRPTKAFHSIKSGETLYQLSKQYDLSIADLLLWNPDLVIEDIALGTRIQISPNN